MTFKKLEEKRKSTHSSVCVPCLLKRSTTRAKLQLSQGEQLNKVRNRMVNKVKLLQSCFLFSAHFSFLLFFLHHSSCNASSPV